MDRSLGGVELTTFEVRPARDRDRDAVWVLAQQFAVSYQPDREHFDAAFSAVLSDDNMIALVAVGDGRTAGYLLANHHHTFFANAPVAWVEEVMVAESDRGVGVGRVLMERAEAWAKEAGAAYVALATRRAGEFYGALGYEESAAFFRKRLH
jgi:GNAT superfamily N-acetyltransferase